MPNITKTFVDNLQPREKDQIFWDDKLTGFGIKITPKGRKVYIFKYRNAVRQQRKPNIGVHGIITCMQARDIAHSWALSLKNGIDPFAKRDQLRSSPTVSELCDRYLNEHARPKKKPRGVKLDESYIKNYIKPRMGRSIVATVNHTEIINFHGSMSKTPAQANRILATLSKMFSRLCLRQLTLNTFIMYSLCSSIGKNCVR